MVIIKRPVITEKTVALAEENNQYTFEVRPEANKVLAAEQLEDLYNVKVERVTTRTRLGKAYKFGPGSRRMGKKTAKKYMVFKLKTGNKIDQFKL